MIAVLEIGGTHVTGALVDPDGWTVSRSTRRSVDADADAATLVAQFVAAGDALDAPAGTPWGVAMPDPFDYARGVALFSGVAKFGALYGLDVGAALGRGLANRPASIGFVNDADAFVLGEWTAGAVRGLGRCAGMTLGTGVGSGWLVDGVPVDPGDPPGGRAHRTTVEGSPLEDIVSRRAIRRAYADGGGYAGADVREIAAAARAGDAIALRVLARAFGALGQVMGRCLAGFGAEALVVGGSMAASWDLFEPSFRSGASGYALPEIRLAADSDAAPVIGAASAVSRAR